MKLEMPLMSLMQQGPFYLSTILGIYKNANSFERKGRVCGPHSLVIMIPNRGALNGLYFRNPNTIYIYGDGVLHNEHGPAVISFDGPGRVQFKHYYLNGKKLPCDDIIIRMIKARRP